MEEKPNYDTLRDDERKKIEELETKLKQEEQLLLQEKEEHAETHYLRYTNILTISDILPILDQEILFCKEHPDDRINKDYRDGFVMGLVQAKFLVAAMVKAVKGKQF